MTGEPGERSDSEAGRSSTDTVFPKGTAPATAGATVIVALGQLFGDETWRQVFAVGGPALAGAGSAVWRWLAERLVPWFDWWMARGRLKRALGKPGISDDDKRKLEEALDRLDGVYEDRIHRRIAGRSGKNER